MITSLFHRFPSIEVIDNQQANKYHRHTRWQGPGEQGV